MKRLLLSFLALLFAYCVQAQCTPSFTAAMSPTGTSLLRVAFTNTSAIPPVTNTWPYYITYFGDGTSSIGSFTSYHNYPTPGTYNVKLVYLRIDSLSNTVLCTDSVTVPVNVYYTSCASTYSATYGPANSQVTFTASTPAGTPNMHYFWNFGDGTGGTGSPVSHTYATGGTYTVTLTAVDSATLCTYTYSSNIVSQGPCYNHYAVATASSSFLSTYFYAYAPYSFSGQTVSYSWAFGDGTTGTGSAPAHTYPAGGSYTYTVTANWLNSSNVVVCTDTFTSTIILASPTVCAGHTASSTHTISGNTVNFTNTSPSFTGETNLYFWDFGDGGFSSAANPVYTYNVPGTYQVRQVTWWQHNNVVPYYTCTDTAFYTITVSAPVSCVGHNATFTKTTSVATVTVTSTAANFTGQTKVVSWNFGDGTTGTGNTATHTYATTGSYVITNTVNWVNAQNTSTVLCTSTSIDSVTVNTNPCAGHTTSFTKTLSGNTVTVTSTSPTFTGQTTSYFWNFGDGGYAYTATASHTYTTPGTYYIGLSITWYNNGSPYFYCQDSATHIVNIGTTTTNSISGYIFKDSLLYPNIDTFKVWLITYNGTTSMLSAVDSAKVLGNSPVYYYFNNKPAGTYLVKAAKLGGIPGTTGLIPTYHDSSVYWSGAQNVVHTGGYLPNQNIWMKTGTVTAGPGFVAGNVTAGANKTTGAPIPNLLVMLRDAANKPIQMTYTDANGDFTFSNIPLGTYSVYPEQINYITTAYNSIALTTASHSKTGVNFGQTNTEIKPKTTGIEVLSAVDAAALYPNPSTGIVNISWKNIGGSVSISVADIAGHKVYELPATSVGNLSKIDLSHLQNGIYLVHIATADGVQTQKMTIMK